MAEQKRTTAGATGSRGRLTGSDSHHTAYRESYCGGVHGQDRMKFSCHLGQPSRTGFTANQRPAIYYSPGLDHTDNPQYGLLLSDNFVSQTKRDYRHHIQSGGSGSLPRLINKGRESGFSQPRSALKSVATEDKTEYQRLFVPPDQQLTVSHNPLTVGPKGESGFTEGPDLQIFTFEDRKSCKADRRQTLSSVMRSDFEPPSFLQGTEARPRLCSLSSRETGFSRGAVSPLAHSTSLLPTPRANSNALTLLTVGKKEPTGSVRNAPSNQVFPNSPYECSHFTTHYKSMFCQQIGYKKVKSGRKSGLQLPRRGQDRR